MIRKSMSITSIALLFLACDRGAPAPASEASGSATQAPVALAPKAQEPAIDLGAIAVEEDFEQEAETSVNASNLAATLDELEKEIDAQ